MKFFEIRFVAYESEDSLFFMVVKDFQAKEEILKAFARIFKKYLKLFVQIELEERKSMGFCENSDIGIDIFDFLEEVIQGDFSNSSIYVETPCLAWIKYGFFEELKRAGLEVLIPDIKLYAYGKIYPQKTEALWYLKGSENSSDSLLYWLKKV